MNLTELREVFHRDKWKKGGTTCLVCDKHGQVYRRRVSAPMAAWLVRFYRVSAQGSRNGQAPWIDLARDTPDRMQNMTRDYSKLAWWGLIEAHPDNPRPTTKKAKSEGRWRCTHEGGLYVFRRHEIIRYKWEYNSEPVKNRDEGPTDTIDVPFQKQRDSAKVYFHYEKLMRGEW